MCIYIYIYIYIHTVYYVFLYVLRTPFGAFAAAEIVVSRGEKHTCVGLAKSPDPVDTTVYSWRRPLHFISLISYFLLILSLSLSIYLSLSLYIYNLSLSTYLYLYLSLSLYRHTSDAQTTRQPSVRQAREAESDEASSRPATVQ